MKSDLSTTTLPLLPGRKAIQHAAIYPLLGIMVTALLFGLLSWQYSAGVALAGGSVIAGSWLAAQVALGNGRIYGAGTALLRLLAAVMIKWALLISVLAIGLVAWHLPALALLIGLVLGLGLQMFVLAKH